MNLNNATSANGLQQMKRGFVRSIIFMMVLIPLLFVATGCEAESNKSGAKESAVTREDAPQNSREAALHSRKASTHSASFPKVELYITRWCGYCAQAKEYLESHGVPFDVYDIEKDRQAANRFRSLSPRGAIPLAVIDGRPIEGFVPELYAQALGL